MILNPHCSATRSPFPSQRPQSGCTTAGHFAETSASGPADCCSQCAALAKCVAWTFHADLAKCDLGSIGKTKIGTVDHATCGCKNPRCGGGSPSPPSPPGPPATCEHVVRPPKPTLKPLPAGKTQPHLVSILVDDLGFDDAAIRRDNGRSHTPNMAALVKDGIMLDRHHTYLWCSPTRRAFLTGRFPAHITGDQASEPNQRHRFLSANSSLCGGAIVDMARSTEYYAVGWRDVPCFVLTSQKWPNSCTNPLRSCRVF
jgi:hypothetical protein